MIGHDDALMHNYFTCYSKRILDYIVTLM